MQRGVKVLEKIRYNHEAETKPENSKALASPLAFAEKQASKADFSPLSMRLKNCFALDMCSDSCFRRNSLNFGKKLALQIARRAGSAPAQAERVALLDV